MTDNAKPIIDINAILGLIPHRYPFILIDAVIALEPGKSITAVKNVTINEPQFTGHFPGMPVMPGVLILESMAQAAVVLAMKSLDGADSGKEFIPFFTGLDGVRFRRPVIPGDVLRLEVSLERRIKTIWKLKGKAYVGQELAAEAELMAALQQKNR